jgi:predicted phosphodiesterase
LKVLLVHGSPRRINEYLYEDRPEASLERLMDQAGADVLVCGHTHLPYHRLLGSGRHVINAGSVGKPKDNNPDACYLVLSAEGLTWTPTSFASPMTWSGRPRPLKPATCPMSLPKCCGWVKVDRLT